MKIEDVLEAFELAGISGPVVYNTEARRLESNGVLIDESRLVGIINHIVSRYHKKGTGK